MFLLHEGVHLATHRLSRETSVQVGRLPKVLEAVDYEADVWAMLHEFALVGQGAERHLVARRGFCGAR
jgi:hypothetical protein